LTDLFSARYQCRGESQRFLYRLERTGEIERLEEAWK
jgi:hypothetical protein